MLLHPAIGRGSVRPRKRSLGLAAASLAVALLGVSCIASESSGTPPGSSQSSPNGSDPAGVGIEPDAVADAISVPGCDQHSIGDDGGPVVGALAVADSDVVGWCFGTPDPRLITAWDELVAITPTAELADVDLIAGFDQPDGETLAFAGMIDGDNRRFVVAVNLATAADDPQELRLTLAHEMSHVFTQTPDQLDVSADPDDCSTFYNGNGCFLPTAYVMAFIDRFWTPDELASIPDPTVADEEGADERCSLDPSFLGAYAASHPEEDLAESFAAFVFGLDVPDAVRPKIDFFDGYPELAAFRDRVQAENQPAPPNTFERCG